MDNATVRALTAEEIVAVTGGKLTAAGPKKGPQPKESADPEIQREWDMDQRLWSDLKKLFGWFMGAAAGIGPI